MAVNDLDIKLKEVASNYGISEHDLAASVKVDRFRQMGLEIEAYELLGEIYIEGVEHAELLDQATKVMNDFIRGRE